MYTHFLYVNSEDDYQTDGDWSWENLHEAYSSSEEIQDRMDEKISSYRRKSSKWSLGSVTLAGTTVGSALYGSEIGAVMTAVASGIGVSGVLKNKNNMEELIEYRNKLEEEELEKQDLEKIGELLE